MGTGLLTPLYRAGLLPQAAERTAQKFRSWREQRTLSSTAALAIKDRGGVVSPTMHLTAEMRSLMTASYAYRARSECALDVASTFPGGDYLEFGSTGLATFRSFLGAFYLHHGDSGFPDTRFYAFDILPETQSLAPYGELSKRCFMVPGYFQATLTEELKAKRKSEKRHVGFAFLNCSSGSSYKTVFDFLLDVLRPDRMFIYMDGYFIDAKPSVHVLYRDFCAEAKRRYNLDSLYMRNAAGCGALFAMIPART